MHSLRFLVFSAVLVTPAAVVPRLAAQGAATAPKPAQTEGAQKAGQDKAAQAAKPESATQGDTHLTKPQIEELLKSIDPILDFASKDTKLPNNRPIKREVRTRDELNRMLREKMNEDKGAKRMERAELVMKKFGLLDRDFDLKPFLLSLLTEQVAGFYDPKTRTVNLLDWVKLDEQKPVMAHELTHALQDNRVNLDKWSDPEPEEISRDEREDNLRVQQDEASTARQAVTEGQAMAVFIDYGLKDSGKTLKTSPEIGDKLQELSADTNGSPVLARAPLVLQESLLFPYSSGLAFEQSVLIHAGTEAAFAGTLDRPPSSSHEILHPEEFLAQTPVPVLAMPDVHSLLDKEWAPYDIGVMGELDVRMTAELFGGPQIAAPLAVAWDGGIYYAAQRKSASAAEKATPASIGLVYLSRWKNADSARSFLKIYAAQLARKYDHLKPAAEKNGDEDHQRFTTDEGDVVLTVEDKTLFISEGFPQATADELEKRFREVQSNGPLQSAKLWVRGCDRFGTSAELRLGTRSGSQRGGELGLGLAAYLVDAGVTKAALASASKR